jgi:hypothetical protein
MKTDRFFSTSTLPVVIWLACLLFPAGLSAAGHQIHIGGKILNFSIDSPTKEMSTALARQVGDVKERFDGNRSALRTVQGPGGERVYLLQDVVGFVAATEKDLDQAIERIQEPGLGALRAWSAGEIRNVQRALVAAGPTAASYSGLSAPRAVAVVASLGWLPMPELASSKKAAPPQEMITVDKADSILDRVGEVVSRIFVLAATDDLEVTLWVGSTPGQKAKFQFWAQGGVEGTSAPIILLTNGQREHVLRGAYAYRTSRTQGQFTDLIQYSGVSERLDLVNGSSFFCCRFDEKYCHHVDSKKECRP